MAAGHGLLSGPLPRVNMISLHGISYKLIITMEHTEKTITHPPKLRRFLNRKKQIGSMAGFEEGPIRVYYYYQAVAVSTPAPLLNCMLLKTQGRTVNICFVKLVIYNTVPKDY